MPRLSLRTKLLAGVLLILAPVLGLLLASFQGEHARRRAQVLDDLTQISLATAALVQRAFDQATAVGWALASAPAIQSMEPSQVRPYLARLAPRYPEYDNLAVFDSEGNLLAETAEPPPDVPRNIRDRPYFQHVVATQRPVVVDLIVSRRTGRPITAVIVPVLHRDGRLLGATRVSFAMDRLETQLGRLEPGNDLLPRQTILLADPTGRTAVYTGLPDLPWEARDLSTLPEMQRALTGEVVETTDLRGRFFEGVRVAAFVRVPQYGWVVATTRAASAAFAPLETSFRLAMLTFVAIAILAVLGALLLAAFLVGPVDRLAAQARALGRGDLERRTEIKTGDELETLGQSFNTMAEQLQGTVQRLQETTGRLQAVFGSIAEGVVVVDASGRVVDANEAALSLGGMTPSDLGEPFTKYLDQFDVRDLDGSPLQPEETPIALALRGESTSGYRVRLRQPSGEERLLSLSGAPVRDERGGVTLAVAVIRDITEERRRELQREALARVAQQIATQDVSQALTTAVHELVSSFGAALARVWLWEEVEQALVLRASAGLSVRTATTGSEFARFRLGQFKIGTVGATREPYWTNELLQEPWLRDREWAGREGIVAFAGLPLLAAERLVGVMGLFSRHRFDEADVAALTTLAGQLGVAVENARLLARLQARVDELEAVAASARAVVRELSLERVAQAVVQQAKTVLAADSAVLWLADPGRRELHLVEQLGFDPEIIGALQTISFNAVLPAAQAASTGRVVVVEDLLAPGAFPEGQKIAERENLRGLLRQPLTYRGRLVGVLGVATRLPHQFGPEEQRLAGALGDVFAVAVENARLFDEVRMALRVREEFLVAAAHELRTPATALKGYVQLLQRRGTHDELEARALAHISQATERATRLAEELVQVYELSEGKMRLEHARFDLLDLVMERAQAAQKQAESHQFLVCSAGPTWIEADRRRLGLVVDTLLENAVRYQLRGGVIHVTVAEQRGQATVEVTDFGVGIPSERLAHVFEPLFEPWPAGSPYYVGMVGLSLYLARCIVEVHGGEIQAESKVGKGSTFRFRLPLISPARGQEAGQG